MSRPTPSHPPTPAVPGTPKTPPPPPRPTKTPLNSLIDCGRAWGRALVGIAHLLTGRPV